MADNCRPFNGRDTCERVAERFSLPGNGVDAKKFWVTSVGEMANKKKEDLAPYSPLVRHGLTTIEPQGSAFLEWDDGKYTRNLPNAFSWASKTDKKGNNEETQTQKEPWKRFIFASQEEDRSISLNDFLVQWDRLDSSEDQPRLVTETICQLIAHRRSKLFGLALANRFVNVMLPHALLEPISSDPKECRRGSGCKSGSEREGTRRSGSWILQPMVSLIRVVEDGGGPFRRMYSLTLFLIPVEHPGCKAREMSECEIDGIVDPGWGLASSPWSDKLPKFKICGPLPGYASRLAGLDLSSLLRPAREPKQQGKDADSETWSSLTLREATEAIVFAVALGMAQGPTARADMQVKRRIGDDVVTSLGSSRVSSVVVVDPKFVEDIDPPRGEAFPGSLESLMCALAGEARIAPPSSIVQRQEFRLDRPFFGRRDYVIGVLPSSSCLVTTVDQERQYGRWESGLMQAGWIAYMAIGAATAIGTLRAIDRDLEGMEGAEPTKIAEIEGEIAVDLHEIYDLDITWNAYRSLYRLLRERLGITRDYQTLQDKMQVLGRETTTRHEVKAQAQLAWLTVAIVALTVLLLIVAIAK
jgi:hypothetical protein